MSKIVINEREFEVPETFTYREVGLIKRMSGCRLNEISSALDAGDLDVIAAIAVIAMRRAGEKITEDEILDLEVASVTWAKEEGDDDGPPAGAATAGGGNTENETREESGPPS